MFYFSFLANLCVSKCVKVTLYPRRDIARWAFKTNVRDCSRHGVEVQDGHAHPRQAQSSSITYFFRLQKYIFLSETGTV